MQICPINRQDCGGDKCVFWITMDDFQGCPLDMADQGIKNFVANTLLPAAMNLDSLVKRFLKLKE